MSQTTNILVVEDEAIVALDIEESLLSLGYKVGAVVNSGQEAIDTAAKIKPDLVLMDIMLQGKMDGIEATSHIKEKLDTPVVYLTAHADKATLDRAKITEPYGYVLKPFKEMELRTVIEIALHRHDAERKRRSEQAAEAGRKNGAVHTVRVPDFSRQITIENPPSDIDQRNIIRLLEKIEPFSKMDESFLKAAAQVCHFARFPAGDVIALEGDESAAGFVVIYGRVAMVKTSTSGKDLIVELLPPLDPFGLLATIERAPYPLTAKAQVDSRILWIPRPVIAAVFDSYPELSREFIDKVLARLRKAHDLSRALAHDLVEVRIASALLALIPGFCAVNEESELYEVEMTRQELGDLTGTTPETVSRVVKTMERDGLLDLAEAGKVKILNMKGLENVADY